jgi:hypothetical protein
MPTRSITTINQLLNRARANTFAKMMLYAENLSVGVSFTPSLDRISNLIWACSSEYATLSQKNEYADLISKNGDDVVSQDGYVSNGYWSNEYAQ